MKLLLKLLVLLLLHFQIIELCVGNDGTDVATDSPSQGNEITNKFENNEEAVEEEEEEEEEENHHQEEEFLTDYQWHTYQSRVDYSDVDFTGNPDDVAARVLSEMTDSIHTRISKIFERAVTAECRALIAEHYGYFVNAIGLENTMPFANAKFTSQCEGDEVYDFDNLPEGVTFGDIQARTYNPGENVTEYIKPEEIVFCYAILTHNDPNATIRLMEALMEPTTIFVIHVDGKNDNTQQKLLEYAVDKPFIHIIDDVHRVRVNWGGFSMVNATLQMINYADQHLDFTHFVHLAQSCYPLASNKRIRNMYATFPKDANFLHIILRPNRPRPRQWNYFVECDDWVHRIYRLASLERSKSNVDFYTSSQWFTISKEFVHYLANPEPETFLYEYLEYIQHVVIADESFFGTVLRNTPFCHKHHNWNFMHLQFDQWENEREVGKRDERKCVMPDPNHCGRSPTTLTLDYLDVLELSEDLFARKFDDKVDPQIKDAIDILRAKEQDVLVETNSDEPYRVADVIDTSFEGFGTLIMAKETVNDDIPLCLGLGPKYNKVRLVPCFHDWVVPTLAKGWELGAVVWEETLPHNRWDIGPCSSDGKLERVPETAEMDASPGAYSETGPRCSLVMMDGPRTGRCFDGESLDVQPGGPVHVYPCTKRWHQYISFGDGVKTPQGSIYTTVPMHIQRRIEETGREQEPYMCLGVLGRGDNDEEDWNGERDLSLCTKGQPKLKYFDDDEPNTEQPATEPPSAVPTISYDEDSVNEELDNEHNFLAPLSGWEGSQLIATRCSNTDAIIEWLFVPFIEEDEEEFLQAYNYTNTDTNLETEEEEEL